MAQRSVTGSIATNPAWTTFKTDNLGTLRETEKPENKTTLAYGEEDFQIEELFRGEFTVTAGSPNYDFDLLGTLVDRFGDTINFGAVKGIVIKNWSTARGDYLRVGGLGVANEWSNLFDGLASGKMHIGPSGHYGLCDPLDGIQVSASNRVLRVQYDGTSGSIRFHIVIMGINNDNQSSSSSTSSSSSSSTSSSSTSSSDSSQSESSLSSASV